MSVSKIESLVRNAERFELLPEIPQRFPFLTVTDLIATPPPKWRVHELIEETGIGVLYAQSGGGKTFATLDLGCAVARGRPWFGLEVVQGSVAYVATEGNLAIRLQAYLAHHDIPPTALANFRVLASAINLLNFSGGDVDALIDALLVLRDELGGLALVIIDTLNRAMPGGNENASEDMGAMVAAAARIKDALGCFVLYVHHCGKEEGRGPRGHSSLKAATEAEINIEQEGGGIRVIHATKVRDAESRRIGAFTLDVVELHGRNSCVIVPCDTPTERRSVDRLTNAERIAIDVLHELLGDRERRKVSTQSVIDAGAKVDQFIAMVDEWRDRFYARRGDSGEAAQKAFRRLRDSLQAKHKVQCFEAYVWPV